MNNQKNDQAAAKTNNQSDKKPTGTKLTFKRTVPLKRVHKGVHYFVGVVSFEDHRNLYEKQPAAEIEIQEGPPRDIAPPYVLCMNFSQVENLEKNAEILDLSQDNKPATEENFINLESKSPLFKAFMKKFWEHQTRVKPCCEHTRKFWEWAFMVWPESGYKWNFKHLDKRWFDYMISHARFREALRKWLADHQGEVIGELIKKVEFEFDARVMANDINKKISEYNNRFFNATKEGRKESLQENLEEIVDLIDNDGFPVLWDPSTVTGTCEESIHCKLACNPDANSNFLKRFNKSLKKKREKPTLEAAIFKYVILDPSQQSGNSNNVEEKNGANGAEKGSDQDHSENGVGESDEDEGLFKIIPNENSSDDEWKNNNEH